jgi:hypothetical protein
MVTIIHETSYSDDASCDKWGKGEDCFPYLAAGVEDVESSCYEEG